MTGVVEPWSAVETVLRHLPMLALAGWVVRTPLVSRAEGHEAITRAGWDGLPLTDAQRAALIRGVRAPDVSLRGLAVFALPSRQPRHALRARASTTTAEGIRAMREFLVARHEWAVAASGERRWEAFGEILHCIQDSYSPAHADRSGARIVRMKHWGPLDSLRSRRARVTAGDEHGFPTDPRDHALVDGQLTDAARAAAEVTRRYLELALEHTSAPERPPDTQRAELTDFLDAWVTGPPPH